MQTGLDKLTLTTRQFSIRGADKSGLRVKPMPYDLGKEPEPEPLLFVDQAGKEIRGQGGHINEPLYNLDINQNGLRVIINPSKPYHPFQLVADTETLDNRVRAVERLLRKRGILFDLDGAKVNRIDIARNVETKEPVGNYRPVFGLLGMPRSKRQTEYPDGYGTGNNSRGVVIYNKGLECRGRGENVPGDRLMRVESQNKKTDAVKRFVGIYSYNDLVTCGVEHCQDVFRQTVNELFKFKPLDGQKIIPFDNGIEEMQRLKTMYRQSWEKKYRAMFGFDDLVALHGGIENYLHMVADVAGNRQTANRVQRELHELMRTRERLMKHSSVSRLYNELLNKLVA